MVLDWEMEGKILKVLVVGKINDHSVDIEICFEASTGST